MTSTPATKNILENTRKKLRRLKTNSSGCTDGERRQKEVEIWSQATEEVKNDMEAGLKEETFNPIDMMVGSGAAET